MPDQTEPPALKFGTNVIIPDPNAPGGSRFIVAGEDSPYRSLDEVPTNLREAIADEAEAEPDEPNEARGAFQMGVPYELTDDGRLGRELKRKVQREIAQLELENDFEEQLEEEAANAQLPPEIASDLQASHEDSVAWQKAQMGASASAADQIADAAIAAQEPPELFVKRGSRHYVQIHRTKLKPAEPVFVKKPDGGYQSIGICDAKAQPPDPPTIL